MAEEMAVSAFVTACLRKHSQLIAAASSQGYALGVPLHPTANDQLAAVLTEHLVRAHLLKATGSSLDSSGNGGSTMETMDGKTVRVRVFDQETLYPPGSRHPCQLLGLETAVAGPPALTSLSFAPQQAAASSGLDDNFFFSAKEAEICLSSAGGAKGGMVAAARARLERRAEEFKAGYGIVKHLLFDTSKALREELSALATTVAPAVHNAEWSIDAVFHVAVFDKIMGALKLFYAQESAAASTAMLDYARQDSSCASHPILQTCAGDLKKALSMATCPVEGAVALAACWDRVHEALSPSSPSSASASAAAADDVLPLFISAVASAAPPDAVAWLEYIRCFLHPSYPQRFQFVLANFEAVLDFTLQQGPANTPRTSASDPVVYLGPPPGQRSSLSRTHGQVFAGI